MMRELLRRRNPRLLLRLSAGPSPPTATATSTSEAGVPNIASTLKREGSPIVERRMLDVRVMDI